MKHKYSCGMGDPLDMLGEEATEVAQAIFKLRRFGSEGLRDCGYTGPTPMDQIHQELGDLIVVYEYCIRTGLLDRHAITEAKSKKITRIKELFGVDIGPGPVTPKYEDMV